MDDLSNHQLVILAGILDEASTDGKSPEWVATLVVLKEDVAMTRRYRCTCVRNPDCPH